MLQNNHLDFIRPSCLRGIKFPHQFSYFFRSHRKRTEQTVSKLREVRKMVAIWSSIPELAAKFTANNFAFSEEEEITSGPFARAGMEGLPQFKTFLEIFQNPRVPGLSLLISVRTV